VLRSLGFLEVPVTEIEPPTDADEPDRDWHNGNGEAPDRHALSQIQLAHKVINKFPDLARRYQKFIGTAAVVSSALIVLSSIAVSKRQHRGESEERILAEITSEEIEDARKSKFTKPEKLEKNKRFIH
jgi:hypothetical protein